jgi:hypothetical protein
VCGHLCDVLKSETQLGETEILSSRTDSSARLLFLRIMNVEDG